STNHNQPLTSAHFFWGSPLVPPPQFRQTALSLHYAEEHVFSACHAARTNSDTGRFAQAQLPALFSCS
ncbi:MAG: hypothetical protein WDZ48_04545, partial [Pirellulales bacterium]